MLRFSQHESVAFFLRIYRPPIKTITTTSTTTINTDATTSTATTTTTTSTTTSYCTFMSKTYHITVERRGGRGEQHVSTTKTRNDRLQNICIHCV